MTSKRAFTLVELLIVVAIIGILASITLAALSQAQGQAKVYRTQTIIAKINDALTEVYERFEFRAKPWTVQDGGCNGVALNCLAHTNNARAKNIVEARIRYLILRAEMLTEMPQCANDLTALATLATAIGSVGCLVSAHQSIGNALDSAADVQAMYTDAIGTAWTDPNTTHVADTVSAELLYLIIETNNPEALAGFKGGEIGDTDGDGLFEFVDAWGNPIRFLRAAPGLQEGVLRTSVPDPTNAANTITFETTRLGQPVVTDADRTNLASGTYADPRLRAIVSAYPDPLYPQRGNDRQMGATDTLYPRLQSQWTTFPVVYSCGADKRSGIVEPPTPPPLSSLADILPISTVNVNFGAPVATGDPDYGAHADNITNHNMVKPF